jgi:hypothetical protein
MGNSACSCDSGGHESEPVFTLLAKRELQEFYGKITNNLGVRSLHHLHMLDDADLDSIGMKKVQKLLFQEAIAEIVVQQAAAVPMFEDLQLLNLEPEGLGAAEEEETKKTSSTKAAEKAEEEQHPLYCELRLNQLHGYYTGLRALGVNQVEHLAEVTEEDLQSLGMKRFDLKTFLDRYLSARPHFGASPRVEPEFAAPLTNGKHVMLSYQWDFQQTVVRVREALRSRGVHTVREVRVSIIL